MARSSCAIWILALSLQTGCGAVVGPVGDAGAEDGGADAISEARDPFLHAEFIAAGFDNSCAVSGGRVFCWGRNGGVLGAGAGDDATMAVEVDERLTNVVAVTVGAEHACALDADGVVTCWGHNDRGQLGRGDADSRADVASVMVTPMQRIAAGAYHTCAVSRDHRTVYCWGANDRGQLGSDTTEVCGGAPCSSRPVAMMVSRAAAIAAGDAHSCAALEYGVVVCWGGEHGSWPVLLDGIQRATSVACGSAHSCARSDDGRIWCWGDNRELQSGGTSEDTVPMPQAVAGISGNSVVAASNHTCVHDDADALWCFGANGSGECGSAPEPSVRATRVGITASDVATGAEHTCAIATDGTVRCWGSNRYGQLGDGTRADSSSPRAVRVQ